MKRVQRKHNSNQYSRCKITNKFGIDDFVSSLKCSGNKIWFLSTIFTLLYLWQVILYAEKKSPNSNSWDGKCIDISDTIHFSGIFCLVLVWQRGSDEFIDNGLKYCILCVHLYW